MHPYEKIIIDEEKNNSETTAVSEKVTVPKKPFKAADTKVNEKPIEITDDELETIKKEALRAKRKFKKTAQEKPVVVEKESAPVEPKKEPKETKKSNEKILYKRIEVDEPIEEGKILFSAKKASEPTPAIEEHKAEKASLEITSLFKKKEEVAPAENKEESKNGEVAEKTEKVKAEPAEKKKKSVKSKLTDEKTVEKQADTLEEKSSEATGEAGLPKAVKPSKLKDLFNKKEKQAAVEKNTDKTEEPTINEAEPEKPVEQPKKTTFQASKEEKKAQRAAKAEKKVSPSPTEDFSSKPERAAEKIPKRTAKWLIALIIILLLLFVMAVCAYGFYQNSLPPEIASVEVVPVTEEDDSVCVVAKVKNNFFKSSDYWFIATDSATAPSVNDEGWTLAEKDEATLELDAGNHFIFAKDSKGNICSLGDEPELNRVVFIKITNNDMTYLPIRGTKYFNVETVSIGNADQTLKWSIADESVALVDENGQIIGVANGTTEVIATTAEGLESSAAVTVTDLITQPDTNTYGKPMLGANQFTDEEAELLDKILFSRVEEAGGYGTRAGVVAAARFITLEFPYRVPYFFENGRLTPAWEGRPYADGEGRYYHVGLYLSEQKFDDLVPEAIRWGPATWGQPLKNWETKYAFVSGGYYPNGFDCSGFVSWVLLNGGFDFGDRGAGDFEGIVDMCDYGEQLRITDELLKSDILKAGDLIYTEGHMAIIMGISEEKIYVAESLITSVRCVSFDRNYSSVPHYLYSYVSLMDDMYENKQGNYTDMWEIPEDYEEVERYWNYPW